MTRGDAIRVKPTNNVYTALAGVGCVVVILGLIALFTQANAVFGDGLFMSTGNAPTAMR